jgi:hypothetical protein
MAITDSQAGTPVTLVVKPGGTTPVTNPPPHRTPLAHTGFDLVAALVAGLLLLVIGTALTASVRRSHR